MHLRIFRNAVEKLARFHDTISNDFFDITFYGRTLSSFSFAERTCHHLPQMANWTCYK